MDQGMLGKISGKVDEATSPSKLEQSLPVGWKGSFRHGGKSSQGSTCQIAKSKRCLRNGYRHISRIGPSES